eukprot:CAMPEP_0197534558 /NCGR_PEP_ID=MMETSP1318-20131121/47553_1 /TAXON_ID=552666 /ORGANISM="Partenskyella glossopodia, Strain RCC365" /LENGTH=122 /DNA_ID=CAMNT_0043091877 /DNA_START=45 /DNA_END=410 /DNA_ORIENTATION=+
MGNEASQLFGYHKNGDSEEGGNNAAAVDVENKKNSDNGEGGKVELSEEDLRHIKIDALFFHTIMALASMYACLLLTRWSSQDYSDREARYLSEESFWIQVASIWLIMTLYVWTLAAPICFPD